MYTIDSLRNGSIDPHSHLADTSPQGKDWMSGQASLAAQYMEQQGLSSIDYIGPFLRHPVPILENEGPLSLLVLPKGSIIHRVDLRPVRGFPAVPFAMYMVTSVGKTFELQADLLVRCNDVRPGRISKDGSKRLSLVETRIAIVNPSRDYAFYVSLDSWAELKGAELSARLQAAWHQSEAQSSSRKMSVMETLHTAGVDTAGLDYDEKVQDECRHPFFGPPDSYSRVEHISAKILGGFPDDSDPSQFRACSCPITRPCVCGKRSGN
ncbi:hypothetical protein PVE_R2G0659 [Pseudomonas veronii 1YdBTEX2]|uniref:Uncharacterized protein n=1 Tax=Pseudomonas veronii 1YdBTEX2 TaxID=1295141 RepID=A0A1D3K8U6_PSEVE|nr:hypothetical protein PVE_R2G0659 [Pseudomonas veronii 1YdBTEX2]